jgi:signal transduction histidine kinase
LYKLIIFLFFLNASCFANSQAGSLTFNLGKSICKDFTECSIFIRKKLGRYSVRLNGEILRDNRKLYNNFDLPLIIIPDNYIRQGERNILEVEIINFKQINISEKELSIDDYSSNYLKYIISLATDIIPTVSSSFFLFIVGILILFLFIFFRDLELFFIFIYVLIACLYLLSFSEIFKIWGNEEVLSGPVHFSLRLLQDVALLALLHNFIKESWRFRKLIRSIYCLYAVSIISMLYIVWSGDYAYSRYLKIMVLCAPLVAFPMGYAFFLSLLSVDKFERKILIPFSAVLFLFQLNDLMVFWEIYKGFYLVKLYIPFVVIFIAFIFIYRKNIHYRYLILSEERRFSSRKLVHDLKSPITALELIKSEGKLLEPFKGVLTDTISRIKGMIDELEEDEVKTQYFDVIECFDSICRIYEDVGLEISSSLKCHNVDLNKLAFTRAISNLIENAIDAGTFVKVHISKKSFGRICIVISDNGNGIPEYIVDEVIEKRRQFITTKDNGNGIGLPSALKFFRQNSIDFRIKTGKSGTTILLYL